MGVPNKPREHDNGLKPRSKSISFLRKKSNQTTQANASLAIIIHLLDLLLRDIFVIVSPVNKANCGDETSDKFIVTYILAILSDVVNALIGFLNSDRSNGEPDIYFPETVIDLMICNNCGYFLMISLNSIPSAKRVAISFNFYGFLCSAVTKFKGRMCIRERVYASWRSYISLTLNKNEKSCANFLLC